MTEPDTHPAPTSSKPSLPWWGWIGAVLIALPTLGAIVSGGPTVRTFAWVIIGLLLLVPALVVLELKKRR